MVQQSMITKQGIRNQAALEPDKRWFTIKLSVFESVHLVRAKRAGSTWFDKDRLIEPFERITNDG
jgi:hypothetical protein